MNSQKGFGVISILLMIFGIVVLGTVATGAVVLLGKAPQCPAQESFLARSEKEIGDTLDKGSVNITDSEATALAQKYIGGQVDDARICFSEGLGHISGKKNLGSINPSFYVSGGVDLSGSVPRATNLSIQLGSLPNISLFSSLATNAINSLISENLAKFELKQEYSASFTNGSLTINNLKTKTPQQSANPYDKTNPYSDIKVNPFE